ncbi:MAG: TraM recognition domain-containing protein [Rhodococcus sp. (in: high G+C Gram-positive bacteria)]|uniref:type IV secretory system conjugative DNA transfer family protein n=1 Tax=Rhodococcus sp. TaxID=1831 RepID=UPI003BB0A3C6
MNQANVKDPAQSDPTTALIIGASSVALLVAGGVEAAMHVGGSISGVQQNVPVNPVEVIIGLAKGRLVWSTGATVVAVFCGLVVLAVVLAGAVWAHRRRSKRTRVDYKARHMGRGRDIGSLTEKECRNKIADLKAVLPENSPPGIQIGEDLNSNRMLRGTIQDLHCDIWGPRTGKSTSRVIPAVLDAPGAVLTTSNKRDVVDATRLYRSKRLVDRKTGERVDPKTVDWTTYGAPGPERKAAEGLRHVDTLEDRPLWVFDPQKVANEEPTWWWNPLSWVTDEVKAADLAEHFAAGDDGIAAKKDPFFDPEGQDLLAGLFLAAAVDDRPITDVYTWATQEKNIEPVTILRAAGNGRYELQADGLAAQYNQTDKQRSGVFTTAKKMIRSLKLSALHPWVRRTSPADRRPHFDPREFVAQGGTMYSLSREGNGSAGPIVTALTVAVIDAAEELATRSPMGRLPTPMVAALDEVANVVRWSQLPSLYSHYGSRGILIMAILQSWSQGVEVWGESGMKKLWSASNVRVYGGGVAVDDGNFLKDMSTAIGDHYEITGSVTQSGHGRSTSRQRTKVRTFTEDDLEALPRGRAVVRSSGNRPVLVRTVPWMVGPHADLVRASIRAHDPEAEQTLDEADQWDKNLIEEAAA